ncbi:putative Mtochondrial processing peptidase [Kockovaella imperatae]|uniref:Putative Mtochondrial processing peptidase n=1 Tax=Kockovaella imperatae TaxID=4999 RepID=A0A1Y1UMA6_9TREE|nr:putative Mtochondrial processing peptidase [Kockovaella imperatae]ORX38657.1 putative Mtochondrial processing peptidase [Kockovaella imperatae]
MRLPKSTALRSSTLIRPSTSSPSLIVRANSSIHRPSLVKKKPPLPTPTITEFPNKLRVATEPLDTPGCFVAAVIDAGTRYETERNSGVTHLLERLAWNSNSKYSAETMELASQQLGNGMIALSGRDTVLYGASTFLKELPLAVSLLGSNIRSPLFLPHEIADAKSAALYEHQLLEEQPRLALGNYILETAYDGKTVGRPSLLSPESESRIGERELRGYMKDWIRPERMVITGLGVDHDQLVELVKENFDTSASSSSTFTHAASRPASASALGKSYATVSNVSDLSLDSDYEALVHEKAKYVGGELYKEIPTEEWTHLAICFEAQNFNHPDVYAAALLQQLLLRGSAFSPGGPGKGMFCRLNENILQRYHAVDHCEYIHEIFTDTGLAGIKITLKPHMAPQAADLICRELEKVTGKTKKDITKEQFSRAKMMLKSTLARAVEGRILSAEDLGKQILTQGKKEPLPDMLAHIDRVTIDDLYRVATDMFRPKERNAKMNLGLGTGAPTIVGIGKNVEWLGNVRETVRQWGLGE